MFTYFIFIFQHLFPIDNFDKNLTSFNGSKSSNEIKANRTIGDVN